MATRQRLSPLDVPIPRPVRDGMAGPMRLTTVVLGLLLLVLVNALTGQKIHRETALLHDGLQTTAHVIRVRYWDGGKSHGSEVMFTYPTRYRTLTGVELTTIAHGHELESAGSFPLWYVPKEPGIRTWTEPSQDDVNLAYTLRIDGFAIVTLLIGGLLLRLTLHAREDRLDLRFGTAYEGRTVSHSFDHTKARVNFVYGPDDTPGHCLFDTGKFTEKVWADGNAITILQREGHPPKVWEAIESVEIASSIVEKPNLSVPVE